MTAAEYRANAIDLLIRLTGMSREKAELIIDAESAEAWYQDWAMGGSGAIIAVYVATALYDNGYAADGTYFGDEA